ncbi:MAG TPA: uroporphyrinogen-III synthase [Moheibacter sp.]|nr:uroporphyrinogen-III synthase [Moheibacter sp.]
MKKILFTKEINANWLKENLADNLDFEIFPALKITIHPQEKFVSKINEDSNKFLVSSQNSVKAISGLNLDGEFYVVGEKTAKSLKAAGFEVVHFENYAEDLADFLLKNTQPQSWNFFCGNHRRETLFEKLIPNGHLLNEIICYDSIQNSSEIDSTKFNGIAFFSPLAVKTFFSLNSLTENSVIFSIGNTTNQEIKKYTNNPIVTAEIPLVEKVIEKINEYYDTEK